MEPIGIVIVGFHANADLTDLTWSILKAAPQIPFYVNLQLVETNKEEAEVAEALGAMLEEQAVCVGITHHLDNCGYARACNDGAHWLQVVSDDEIQTLAFFNSDTQIKAGVLENCTRLLWADDSYGILGPRQIDQRGRLTHAGIFGSDKHPKHRGWWEPAHDMRYSDIDATAMTVSGSAYFVKTPVWNELRDCSTYQEADPDSYGAFLQTQHYFEETWCSYHARAHGYRVVYNGSATMVHKWMGSTPRGEWQTKVFHESREQFRAACDLHGIEHE